MITIIFTLVLKWFILATTCNFGLHDWTLEQSSVLPKTYEHRIRRIFQGVVLAYFIHPFPTLGSHQVTSTQRPDIRAPCLSREFTPSMCECYPHIGERLKKLLASFFNEFSVPCGNVVLICSVLRSHESALESVTPAYLNCLTHSLGLHKRMAYLWLAIGYLDDNFR